MTDPLSSTSTPPFPPDSGPSGCLITVEGIDGAGKSSHIEALAARWRARGLDVVCTREPGGTPLAESVRELVLHRSMDALTEALLVFAARRDHLQARIEPALARGAVVLCDRYTDASFAYQGGGRGLSLGVLSTLEHWVQAGRQPDLTLWFELDPEIAALRRGAARTPDRFESEAVEFFRRVDQGYRDRFSRRPEHVARIDASGTPGDVWKLITQALELRGW